MMMKRVAAGILAGLLSASLIAGCGGDSGKSSGGTAKPAAASTVSVPSRAPVSTPPTTTFKFGEHEAKVYELKGVDAWKESRTNIGHLAVTKDAIYFHGKKRDGDPQQYLWKLSYNKEQLTAMEPVAPANGFEVLGTNGTEVYFRSNEKTLDVYDGKTLRKGKEWQADEMVGSSAANTKDIFFLKQGGVAKSTADDTSKFDMVVKQIDANKENIGGMDIVYADGKEIYVRGNIRKQGAKVSTPTLLVFDMTGKEIRRYEGIEDTPRGWAVTANYVVHASAKGMIRVFDRATGSQIGEATLELRPATGSQNGKEPAKLRPFQFFTVTGNDVIMFDDKDNKFYRIDF